MRNNGGGVLPCEQAFVLHDTYGFPIDLTLEMAREQGLDVDEAGFRELMTEQRERAKADARSRKAGVASVTAYREVLERGGTTGFTGYVETVSEGVVTGILRDGVVVPVAREGDHVEIVLNRTPFYADAGGQLVDHGRITSAGGASLEVYDVQTPVPGLFIHRATVSAGELTVGEEILGHVDIERRRAISRAHTATHLVHRAFREFLGDTATQMGSENAPGRLRFDFPAAGAVGDTMLRDV